MSIEDWVPWLLAYTGARPGEISQLRREDLRKVQGPRARSESVEWFGVRVRATLRETNSRCELVGGAAADAGGRPKKRYLARTGRRGSSRSTTICSNRA